MKIKFKKLSDTAKVPTVNNVDDVGFDLYCDESFDLAPGETKKVKTNIQLADMPLVDAAGNKIFLKIEGRSGLSMEGIFPIGGIIDPVYRGEVGVVLTRNVPGRRIRNVYRQFKAGDRIAQLVIYKVAAGNEITFEEADEITVTTRGSSGFGSSGR